MTRPTHATIKLSHIQHNYRLSQDLGHPAYAVIKANAYGHGMIEVARALPSANGFAVACVDEALQLRQAGITQAILVLEGGYSPEEWQQAIEFKLEMVLHHESQLSDLLSCDHYQTLNCWLKIDTGMNRLGFRPEAFTDIAQRCQHAGICIKTLMTHFASADDVVGLLTEQQHRLFLETTADYRQAHPDCQLSTANSAAILSATGLATHTQQDITELSTTSSTTRTGTGLAGTGLAILRPGIMLYGSSPFSDQTLPPLKPSMTLHSEIIACHEVKAGETIGYGAKDSVDKPGRIGIVAIGYGDGYPRLAPKGTPVWVAGRRVGLIGRVSMDMLCVDLSMHPDIGVGDAVELWGEHIGVNDIAERCQTIGYELLCQITARVPRIYLD